MKRINGKRMIVLSLDAVGSADMEYLLKSPVFREIKENGVYCDNVSSVYPSLTYPAHTSIVTGRWPRNHGVVNNTLVQSERLSSPDWMWQRSYVKTTTIYDEVLKQGGTVASICWPVTAKSEVTWCMPEVLPNRPWENQISVSMQNGTPFFQAKMFAKFAKLLKDFKQPHLDDFSYNSAMYTLRKYDPDLTLIHLTDLDTHRHWYGVNGPEIEKALDRHIMRVEELVDYLKKSGKYEDTQLVILGDHYQKDVDQVFCPNYYLKEAGYIDEKKPKRWRAISHEADGCAYIYVRNEADKLELVEFFSELQKDGKCGIKKIFAGNQAKKLGADSRCALMLEAVDGGYFCDRMERPQEEVPVDADGKVQGKYMRATHGYFPEDDSYKTFFMMTGPDIPKGKIIEKMNLIDEGPTLANLLEVDLGDVDGKCILD